MPHHDAIVRKSSTESIRSLSSDFPEITTEEEKEFSQRCFEKPTQRGAVVVNRSGIGIHLSKKVPISTTYDEKSLDTKITRELDEKGGEVFTAIGRATYKQGASFNGNDEHFKQSTFLRPDGGGKQVLYQSTQTKPNGDLAAKYDIHANLSPSGNLRNISYNISAEGIESSGKFQVGTGIFPESNWRPSFVSRGGGAETAHTTQQFEFNSETIYRPRHGKAKVIVKKVEDDNGKVYVQKVSVYDPITSWQIGTDSMIHPPKEMREQFTDGSDSAQHESKLL